MVKGHVDSLLLVRAIRYAIERKRTADQLSRYAKELREKNEQMEEDLKMAREIQWAILPQQYPRFPPCLVGIEVAHLVQACSSLS